MYHYIKYLHISNTHYIILLEVTMNLIEESLSAPIQNVNTDWTAKNFQISGRFLSQLKTYFWQILLNFGRFNIVIVTAVLAGSIFRHFWLSKRQKLLDISSFQLQYMHSIFIPKKLLVIFSLIDPGCMLKMLLHFFVFMLYNTI